MRRAGRAVIVVLLAACGRDTPQVSAGATGSGAVASGAGVGAGAKPPCPPTGLWARCSVLERLDRAGLAPRVDSGVAREPPLGDKGLLVHVGNSELELYLYPDSVSRKRAASMLPAPAYVGYQEEQGMQERPTLIQSANLIAILNSRNDHQRERVGDAISAGPPQPAKK